VVVALDAGEGVRRRAAALLEVPRAAAEGLGAAPFERAAWKARGPASQIVRMHDRLRAGAATGAHRLEFELPWPAHGGEAAPRVVCVACVATSEAGDGTLRTLAVFTVPPPWVASASSAAAARWRALAGGAGAAGHGP
jgi:hypothetical protein